MSLEKQIAFDMLETDNAGTVFIKFQKGIFDTGTGKWAEWAPGVPIVHPHRLSVNPDQSPEDAMEIVKKQMEPWGYTVSAGSISKVSNIVKALRV